jgi:hypothetical protein
MTKNELTSLTLAELKALAKKKKVAVPAGARKADIVPALLAATAGPAKKQATRKKAPAKVKTAAVKSASTRTGSAAKKAAPGRLSKAGKAAAVKKAAAAVDRTTGKGPVVRKVLEREWQMPPGREEPTMAQERVADAKFYTGATEAKPAGPYGALPHEYGQERLVLLARDPHTVFAFWEVPQWRLDQEQARMGGNVRLCVRVYDVTGVSFNGGNELGYFDQEVYERVGSWYFDLGRAGHSFCADLGLRSPDGRFQSLIRSNTVAVPREGFSDAQDEEWMVLEEEFLRLYGLSGQSLGGISSAQVRELMRKRRLLEISSPGQFGGTRRR